MGIRYLEVPKWGLSMEEGTVVAWLIAPGTAFSEGDEICEIETSKITNVVEAPFDGVLRKVLAEPGETLPVGAPIAISAGEDVSDAEIEAAGGAPSTPQVETPAAAEAAPPSAAPAPQTASKTPTSSTIPEPLKGVTSADVVATPSARALAQQHGIDLGKVPATGRGNRVSVSDILTAVETAGGQMAADIAEVAALRASPLARRVAGQKGIDLGQVTPSGAKGKILLADVEQAAQPAPAPAPQAAYCDIPMTGMRKTIAERLTASARDIPHFRLSSDIRLDALLALRKQLNESAPQKISVTDMLVKAASKALIAVPGCNVQVQDGAIRQFDQTDICLAVALDGGLLTPKVSGVDSLSLSAVARETAALIEAARAGTLQPDQFTGGTFTISNLGMYGVDQFDAIINPPQGAILAVGAGRTEGHGYRHGDGPATVMTVTLSCDHRAIDGALGAQWLQAFRAAVETPMQILL